MNHCVPDWDMEDDPLPSSSDFQPSSGHLKKPSAPSEDELVELVWQDGQVMMQKTSRRAPPMAGKPETIVRRAEAIAGNSGFPAEPLLENPLFIQEDEMAAWLHCSPLDDFCSELFTGNVPQEKTKDHHGSSHAENSGFGEGKRVTQFSQFLRRDAVTGAVGSVCGGESTVVDSNDTVTAAAATAPVIGSGKWSQLQVGSSCLEMQAACEATSSGGSGAAGGGSECRKRKGREGDEAECQSEDVESFDGKKASQRSATARRTRAAEVHNLSERRRRDRINERMRALQELIPHCNKSDKASMLDEAIEYLKTLQLQVQMMSMGCAMPPMMLPGIQQYVTPMGMGMGVGMGMGMGMEMAAAGLSRPLMPFSPMHTHPHAPILPVMHGHGASGHSSSRLPLPPLRVSATQVADTPSHQASNLPIPHPQEVGPSHVGQQNQTPHNSNFLDAPYPYYMGFHPMQMPPQAMNILPYSSNTHIMQQNQPPSQSNPSAIAETSNNAKSG
ncbi:hypothetical protein AMTRI_Chr07g26310 [Amborella trichopoda]|nr:transcription factor PIF1 isoform X1 [Amborella trichopoda]XP_020529187.1 transcription factor PIF1 isoform X1 [Amborella trichopoda]|eukprot:XP_011627020.2 transcription factor PIF1 isoform X1 [Amborella trichopoda]